VRLKSSSSGSYLECVSTSSGGSFTTHLGVSHPPNGVILVHYPISFLIFSLLFFSFVPPSMSSLFYYVLKFRYSFFHHHHHCVNCHNHLIILTIFCFSLCPLEVNIHTYLTTWLNSCPVGVFFRLSP